MTTTTMIPWPKRVRHAERDAIAEAFGSDDAAECSDVLRARPLTMTTVDAANVRASALETLEDRRIWAEVPRRYWVALSDADVYEVLLSMVIAESAEVSAEVYAEVSRDRYESAHAGRSYADGTEARVSERVQDYLPRTYVRSLPMTTYDVDGMATNGAASCGVVTTFRVMPDGSRVKVSEDVQRVDSLGRRISPKHGAPITREQDDAHVRRMEKQRARRAALKEASKANRAEHINDVR